MDNEFDNIKNQTFFGQAGDKYLVNILPAIGWIITIELEHTKPIKKTEYKSDYLSIKLKKPVQVLCWWNWELHLIIKLYTSNFLHLESEKVA